MSCDLGYGGVSFTQGKPSIAPWPWGLPASQTLTACVLGPKSQRCRG
jgi:hypothetical protein